MTVNQKRNRLRRIFDQTTSLTSTATTYADLLAALVAFTANPADATQTGAIKRTRADDAEVEYFGASENTVGVDEIDDLAGQLRDLYDQASERLSNSGVASPTDRQIWDEMMFILKPIREFGASYCGVGLV